MSAATAKNASGGRGDSGKAQPKAGSKPDEKPEAGAEVKDGEKGTSAEADLDLSDLMLEEKLVEETAAIVERRNRVEQLLESANQGKEKVSPEIFQRVTHDYQRQLEEIAAEYVPLKESVLTELRRIRVEELSLKSRLDELNELVEELRFRCQVGEFSKQELDKKEKEKQPTFNELQAKLSTIESTYKTARGLLGDDVEQAFAEPQTTTVEPEDVVVEESADVTASAESPDDSEPAASEDDDEQPGDDVADQDESEVEAEGDEASDTSPPAVPPPDGVMVMDVEDANPDGTIVMTKIPPTTAQGTEVMAAPPFVAESEATGSMPPPPGVDAPEPSDDAPPPPPPPGDDLSADGTLLMPTAEPAKISTGSSTAKIPRALLNRKKPGGGKTFVINEDSMVIGRSTTSDVIVQGATVSRKHAVITQKDGTYFLEDVSSGGGVTVNGERQKNAELANGDEIVIGATVFEFQLT